MKTLNDYMSMSYRMEVVEDKTEGGFVVSYPEDVYKRQDLQMTLSLYTATVPADRVSVHLFRKV